MPLFSRASWDRACSSGKAQPRWLGQVSSCPLTWCQHLFLCLTGLLEGLGALEGLEILGDLAARDQISFSPHPGAQGLLPAGSCRDGTARRAPAPAPGIQGASCCVTLHVLYACSFDKNKSSCLQFALNYIKVSAALTAPLRNDLGRCWQMALGEPGISPCSGSSSGSQPAGRRPRPPSALPGPGTNFHLYGDPHFSPVCTQRSVLQ